MRYSQELIESIDRAFTLHASGGRGFIYLGYNPETKTFGVRFPNAAWTVPFRFDLTRREAWVLAMGLAAAMTTGIDIGVERERQVGGIAR